MGKVQVTKFDAIRAQLDAAIELYFVSDNIVATHTLVAAAYNALRDIAKREGREHPFLKTGFLQSLPKSERQRVIQILNEPENFFKHADRDTKTEISFDSELTELLLIDACGFFRDSSLPKPKYYDALKFWVGKTKDDIPEDSAFRSLADAIRHVFKSKGKKEFWGIMSQHLINRSTGAR